MGFAGLPLEKPTPPDTDHPSRQQENHRGRFALGNKSKVDGPMTEDHIPYTPRERAHTGGRVSTSTSISTSESSLKRERTGSSEDDLALDTYALAKAIGEFWGVDDPELVVIQFGGSAVAGAHRRMLYMSRRQKLAHVTSLSSYFMSILINRFKKKPETDERSDEFYEEYQRRQAERGL